MVAVETIFKYKVDNPKCTRFSVSRVIDTVEWSPEGKTVKYLFPREISLRPSVSMEEGDLKIKVYVVNEGDLLTVDYATGSWRHTHHSDYALLIARRNTKSILDGMEVENAETIYSKHDNQLTIIAHKGLIDQGYLVSQNKPISNAIAYYAKQILTKTVSLPQLTGELQQKSEEISGRLKTLIDSL